ncbi:MAG: transcription antitermination factor NusB [Mariprofundaceae bacterium]
MNIRALAIEVLYQVFEHQNKASVMLDKTLTRYAIEDRNRGLLHELVYGVLRRYFSLEADFSRYLKQKPDEKARLALLIGAYQIRHMRIPAHAAVGETVEAVKVHSEKASGMVNAVLRKVANNDPPSKLKPHQRAELPKWMYAKWRDAFGAEQVQAFCESLKETPDLCVAVFTDRETWIKEARAMGLSAVVGELSPYAVLLPAGSHVPSLPRFEQGAFVVMDQAAQAAVMALEIPKPDAVILDVCAAPGGKTVLLAHRFPDAKIIAVELNAKRIPRLEENLARLNCKNVNLLQADALNLPLPNKFADVILLDAPCSASGVLRRHPDAKFLHASEAIDGLSKLQKCMVDESLRVLNETGQLVYAVCSIHPEENEQVILAYVDAKFQRLYPSQKHDGFFFSRLIKEVI